MGGASSKITSGDQLLSKTKEVREMSNALFTFMFSQWEDKEIWEIANNPGDYVVALSDLITNQFHILGYTTKRNQIGEIYFQKYDKLKPPAADGEKNIVKQRENTMIIAFYFIRLFQIMGAMLLVVKDVSFPIVDPVTGVIQDLATPELLSRPIISQQVTLSRFKSWEGGAQALFPRDIVLGPYEFLRFYMRQVSSETIKTYSDKYGVSLPTGIYQITPNLFFEFKTTTQPDYITATNLARQRFILVTVSQGQTRADLKTQEMGITAMIPSSMQGFVVPASFATATLQLARFPLTVSFDMRVGGRTPQTASVNRVDTDAKKDTYANGAEYYFDSGTNVDLLLAQYDSKKEFTKILELVVLLAIRASNSDKSIQLYKITKTEEVTGQAAIGKMPEKIKSETINEVYQSLRSKKGMQPHCISRALQLLDTKSINDTVPMKGKTSICKFAVGDQAGPVELTLYKPIKSVAQLFGRVNPTEFKESQAVLSAFVGTQATTIPLTVSELSTAGQKGESDALAAALKRLSDAFRLQDGPIARPKGCKTIDVEDVTQPMAVNLQTISHQLLAYHVNQTIEISKFLKSIFNIGKNPDGSWNVEGPRSEILLAGFPMLDQLTVQARELLVDYYANCETLYQKGVVMWTPEAPQAAEAADAPQAAEAPLR